MCMCVTCIYCVHVIILSTCVCVCVCVHVLIFRLDNLVTLQISFKSENDKK